MLCLCGEGGAKSIADFEEQVCPPCQVSWLSCISARLAWHLAVPRVSRKFGLELEVELEGSTAHYTGVPV